MERGDSSTAFLRPPSPAASTLVVWGPSARSQCEPPPHHIHIPQSLLNAARSPDCLGMATVNPNSSAGPAVGTSLIILRTGVNPCTQHPAVILGGAFPLVDIEVPGVEGWTPGEGAVLASVTATGRTACSAKLEGAKPGRATFRCLTAWRSINGWQARATRFPVSLPAVLYAGSTTKLPGTVTDLSTGGLCLHLEKAPVEGARFVVELSAQGFSAFFPVTCRARREADSGSILHFQFDELSPSASAFLRMVMRDCRESFQRTAA